MLRRIPGPSIGVHEFEVLRLRQCTVSRNSVACISGHRVILLIFSDWLLRRRTRSRARDGLSFCREPSAHRVPGAVKALTVAFVVLFFKLITLALPNRERRSCWLVWYSSCRIVRCLESPSQQSSP